MRNLIVVITLFLLASCKSFDLSSRSISVQQMNEAFFKLHSTTINPSACRNMEGFQPIILGRSFSDGDVLKCDVDDINEPLDGRKRKMRVLPLIIPDSLKGCYEYIDGPIELRKAPVEYVFPSPIFFDQADGQYKMLEYSFGSGKDGDIMLAAKIRRAYIFEKVGRDYRFKKEEVLRYPNESVTTFEFEGDR